MAEWNKMCCAVDFSDGARFAMAEAAELAQKFDAELVLVHVHEPPLGAEVPLDESALEMISVDLERALAAWRLEAGRRLGEPVRSQVRFGDPAAEIVRFARDAEVDLVVLGSHGSAGFRAGVLGSVAERVVRDAPCPVLVIRPTEIRQAAFVPRGGEAAVHA